MRRIAAPLAACLASLTPGQLAVAQVLHPSCPQITMTPTNIGVPPDMRFTLRKDGGRRVLWAEGGITRQTPSRLTAALKKFRPVTEIWLRSGGGDAQAGNDAARILRQSGVPVRIPNGWWCISACNFLFFGGAIRQIDAGGQFGVHMATSVNGDQYRDRITRLAESRATGSLLEDIALREQTMAKLTADDIDVVLRMGISRKLLSDVMYAQRADEYRGGRNVAGQVPTFRCLTQAEMRRYNVVNTD